MATPLTSPYRCQTCRKCFSSDGGLNSHRKAKAHLGPHRCMQCDKGFPTLPGLQAHPCYPCASCKKGFRSVHKLTTHCQAMRHQSMICNSCEKAFLTLQELETHLNTDSNHVSRAILDGSDGSTQAVVHFWCSKCNVHFSNKQKLHQHFGQSATHSWCKLCLTDFPGDKELHEHECPNKGHYKCPFCPRVLERVSALGHHLESGTHHFLNRLRIAAAVHTMDIIPPVSIRRLIGTGDEDGGNSNMVAVSTPTELQNIIATEASFNGTTYACDLCTKSFRELRSLNTHLNSAAHDEDQFRCPDCKRAFTLVSGLVQHLESGSCGLADFSEIRRRFENLNDQFNSNLVTNK